MAVKESEGATGASSDGLVWDEVLELEIPDSC